MLVRRNGPVLGLRLGSDRGLDRVLDGLFNEFPVGDTCGAGAGRYPAVNTSEDDTSFTVEAELPGLKREDIDISVLGNELRITGGSEETKEESGAKVHRRERYAGKFSRVLRFPVDVEGEGVKAEYEAGILTVTLPKAATALPRKIEVKG